MHHQASLQIPQLFISDPQAVDTNQSEQAIVVKPTVPSYEFNIKAAVSSYIHEFKDHMWVM